jgi:hypothetical protein
MSNDIAKLRDVKHRAIAMRADLNFARTRGMPIPVKTIAEMRELAVEVRGLAGLDREMRKFADDLNNYANLLENKRQREVN